MIQCIVTLEMARPGVPFDTFFGWCKQRQKEEAEGRSQNPLHGSDGKIRVWRGTEDAKDWDRLSALKVRDGWGVVSHRRDFIDAKELIVERTDER